jgi:predicted nuclease of predicted toxin-antitoxin system
VKFLLDESADARLQPYLRSQGYDASRVAREHPAGLPDREVLGLAKAEQRILLTADHDFGDLVFRQGEPHQGVILFRLGDYAEIELWIERLKYVLQHYGSELDQFIVVTRRRVRVRRYADERA